LFKFLVDFLNTHPKRHNFVRPNRNINRNENEEVDSMLSVLLSKGNKFEEHVKISLENKFLDNFIDIGGSHLNAYSKEFFDKTKNAINSKIPIIYQGVLHDYDNKIFGIPDLIVREDYIHQIFSDFAVDFPGGVNPNKYHVIEIKFSTVHLSSDGIHVLNKNVNMKYYKSQLLIYTRLLNRIQHIPSNTSFILGRRAKYTSKGEQHIFESCFERPGYVNYNSVDVMYKEYVDNAIEIKRDIMNNGHTFDLFPPSRHYLYPNMCIDSSYDNGWDEVKKEIAKRLDEITLIPNCRVLHRKNAHQKNIFRWTDPNCNSETLGIGGQKIPGIVDKILDSLRSGLLITPSIIMNNYCEWKNVEPLELFVDFETANDLVIEDFSDFPNARSSDIIYMIGAGWYDKRNNWNYRSFIVNKLNYQEEKNIINDFNNFVTNLSREYSRDIYNTPLLPKLYHWGHIEETKFLTSKIRHGARWKLERWVDICSVLRQEPVTFNGVFNYKLKDVGKFLADQNLIQTRWDNSDTSSGADSLIAVKQCLEIANEKNISLKDTLEINDIIKYNETDCKVTSEIFLYLRSKHT